MDHSELPGSSKGQSKTQIIVPCKISALKALGIISCEGRGLFNFVLGTFLKKRTHFLMFLVRNTQAESRCVKIDLFLFEMDKLRKWSEIGSALERN